MPTPEETLQELLRMAAGHFGKDAASLEGGDDLFEALGIDSLQALDLLTRLETHFRVELPDYELSGVSDFRTLAERIHARL